MTLDKVMPTPQQLESRWKVMLSICESMIVPLCLKYAHQSL